jgi:hypothetical protein
MNPTQAFSASAASSAIEVLIVTTWLMVSSPGRLAAWVNEEALQGADGPDARQGLSLLLLQS